MIPLPDPFHGNFQAEVACLLHNLTDNGRVITECPISTADGVRAADVAWASPALIEVLGRSVCFPQAPEICVEVISPSNSEMEIEEKMALYFDAGAKEVWTCTESGAMNFFAARGSRSMRASHLCPQFPKRIELR